MKGFYRFKFIGIVGPQQKDGSILLKMQVTFGPSIGRIHTEYLHPPGMCQPGEEAKANMAFAKNVCYLKRFNIVAKDAKQIGLPDWNRFIGQEGVFEISERKWAAKPAKGDLPAKEAGSVLEIEIGHCWDLAHGDLLKLSASARAEAGLPLLPGQPIVALTGSGPAPAQATQQSQSPPPNLAETLWK